MNIRDLVAEYLGITPQRGDEWQIPCPSPEHDDARPSANIYVGEPMQRMRNGKVDVRRPGVWVCFSCNRSGRISNEAIENYTPTTDRNIDVIEENLAALGTTVRTYPDSVLDLYDYPGGVHPYWLSRFAEATARRWRLGYDAERDAGTYPLRTPDGRLLGVVARSLDTEATGWKYRYPAGVEKSELLFGYAEVLHHVPGAVAVCEGALDAIACWEAGTPAVAILGSRISEAQVHLINRMYPDRLLLCFDNDAAGHNAQAHLLGSGIDCHSIWRVELPVGVKDIAELSVTDRIMAFVNAQPVDLLAPDYI